MAVLIEAISVIVRLEAVAQRYPGGTAKFISASPNRTLCADSELARIGFMHPDDVGAFVRGLEKLGLVFVNQQNIAVDIAVVDQRQGLTAPCPWLELFQTQLPGGGTVTAVRLAGSQDKMLSCPAGWQYERSLSAQFKYYPGRQSEELEFVRSEPNMDVFRNRTTGKEEYLARARSAADDEIDRHNALYKEAAELIRPFLDTHVRLGDPLPAKSAPDQAKVGRACELLKEVTKLRPENWNAWWILGMSHRFLGDAVAAYGAFKRSFEIAPTQIETGRNLAMECIGLGYGPEAVEVTTRVLELRPEDSGLMANRALALLVNGELKEAQTEVERALKINPSDKITLGLNQLLANVRAGRIPQPSKWPPG